MKIKKLFIGMVVVTSLLAIAGCATAGNSSLRKETEVSVQQKVIPGKTTKVEVKAMFGSPSETSFTDSGLEIWKYSFAKMSADAVSYIPIVNLFGSSTSGTSKTLTVMFDESDIVKKSTMSEAPVSVKSGIF